MAYVDQPLPLEMPQPAQRTAASRARSEYRRKNRPIVAASAPSPVAGALAAIEGVGFVLAEAGRSGHGLDALSCDDVTAQLRRVYVVVRALRVGSASRSPVARRYLIGRSSAR